ncbi:30S ribosomal protein S6 [Candidatus Vidania fulgoroideae]|nr:30S ribosomal protein S6 [Candidatus Vidania fulgoroideae]
MIYEIIIIFKKNLSNNKNIVLDKIISDIGKKKILRTRNIENINIKYPIKKQRIVDFFFIFCKRERRAKEILEKRLKFNNDALRYIIINVPNKDYNLYLENDLPK